MLSCAYFFAVKKKSHQKRHAMRMRLGVALLVLLTSSEVYADEFADDVACPQGWNRMQEFLITGYYLPHETDYDGKSRSVNVDGKERLLNAEFLAAVDDQNGNMGQGWGQTIEGDFVGHYGKNGEWISSTYPKTDSNTELTDGVVAVDPAVIPLGSRLMIPGLPHIAHVGPQTVFIAADTGINVKGQHIDVFTGAGVQARNDAEVVTTDGPRAVVCVKLHKP
jgi:3D (Asp-Asp-Asp) domain-containing protein